jgi:hypothetical protein
MQVSMFLSTKLFCPSQIYTVLIMHQPLFNYLNYNRCAARSSCKWRFQGRLIHAEEWVSAGERGQGSAGLWRRQRPKPAVVRADKDHVQRGGGSVWTK